MRISILAERHDVDYDVLVDSSYPDDRDSSHDTLVCASWIHG